MSARSPAKTPAGVWHDAPALAKLLRVSAAEAAAILPGEAVCLPPALVALWRESRHRPVPLTLDVAALLCGVEKPRARQDVWRWVTTGRTDRRGRRVKLRAVQRGGGNTYLVTARDLAAFLSATNHARAVADRRAA